MSEVVKDLLETTIQVTTGEENSLDALEVLPELLPVVGAAQEEAETNLQEGLTATATETPGLDILDVGLTGLSEVGSAIAPIDEEAGTFDIFGLGQLGTDVGVGLENLGDVLTPDASDFGDFLTDIDEEGEFIGNAPIIQDILSGLQPTLEGVQGGISSVVNTVFGPDTSDNITNVFSDTAPDLSEDVFEGTFGVDPDDLAGDTLESVAEQAKILFPELTGGDLNAETTDDDLEEIAAKFGYDIERLKQLRARMRGLSSRQAGLLFEEGETATGRSLLG